MPSEKSYFKPTAKTKKIIARLLGLNKGKLTAVRQALIDGAERIIVRARTHYLAGESLNAIHSRSRVNRSNIKGTGSKMYVNIGTNVKTLVWWETGFDVPSYEIVPRNVKALKFAVEGNIVFTKKVLRRVPRHQEPKAWLAPSFDDERLTIHNMLQKAGIKDIMQ